ncbi:MAG: SDR family NAD(P)-dependent oxidoreductase [Sphingomonadaceae bacterium]
MRVDVRDPVPLAAAVAQATETFGKIDLLIANAGIYAGGALTTLTDDIFDAVVRINLYEFSTRFVLCCQS